MEDKTLRCSICDLEKNITEFGIRRDRKKQHTSQCKQCKNTPRRKIKEIRPGQKHCKLCDRWHNIDEFRKDSSKKSGHHSNCRSCNNIRRSKYLKENINFSISTKLRIRLCSAVINGYKAGSAVRDLGCTIEFLKKYIEALFKPGMSWDNYSLHGWHLDHIIPLSSFDLTNREQFLKACHYTNLQPLWAKDNLSKGSKVIL